MPVESWVHVLLAHTHTRTHGRALLVQKRIPRESANKDTKAHGRESKSEIDGTNTPLIACPKFAETPLRELALRKAGLC